MARSHGRILTGIWQDPDFLALEPEPQRLYLFLLSQPDLTQAGLLPLRARRWAQKYAGGSADAVRAALGVLEAARFVVVDDDTEEVLVRTFVRNDGVYKQPKVMLRMREDAKLIESERLREAFAVELDRLPLDELSDEPGRGGAPSVNAQVSGVVDALREDFGNPSGRVSEGYAVPPTCARARSPYPQPPTPETPTVSQDAPAAAVAETKPARPRGTRVPEPFPITPDMVEWARTETPGIDHRAVTERFVDYWRGVPGSKGVKLDWPATWRNWLRREHERARPVRGGGSRLDDNLAVVRELAAEEGIFQAPVQIGAAP
ncbi:hypothetical protein [Cellulomonas sp.]|uniref:hypothetical protein n=1 Tax=Cellulomonas sp. TaxID=40001 RepID=UPI001B0F3EA5|nr:hypothetical protein [Cellulomonas sp.]MBO9555566.1 hypothetical protein [Cellulomonas sp.]